MANVVAAFDDVSDLEYLKSRKQSTFEEAEDDQEQMESDTDEEAEGSETRCGSTHVLGPMRAYWTTQKLFTYLVQDRRQHWSSSCGVHVDLTKPGVQSSLVCCIALGHHHGSHCQYQRLKVPVIPECYIKMSLKFFETGYGICAPQRGWTRQSSGS